MERPNLAQGHTRDEVMENGGEGGVEMRMLMICKDVVHEAV